MDVVEARQGKTRWPADTADKQTEQKCNCVYFFPRFFFSWATTIGYSELKIVSHIGLSNGHHSTTIHISIWAKRIINNIIYEYIMIRIYTCVWVWGQESSVAWIMICHGKETMIGLFVFYVFFSFNSIYRVYENNCD